MWESAIMWAEYLNQPELGGEGCLVFQRVILGKKCWYYTIGITQLDCIPFAERTLTFADLGRSPSSLIFNIRSKSFFHDYYFLFILFHNFHKEVAVTFTHLFSFIIFTKKLLLLLPIG